MHLYRKGIIVKWYHCNAHISCSIEVYRDGKRLVEHSESIIIIYFVHCLMLVTAPLTYAYKLIRSSQYNSTKHVHNLCHIEI